MYPVLHSGFRTNDLLVVVPSEPISISPSYARNIAFVALSCSSEKSKSG